MTNTEPEDFTAEASADPSSPTPDKPKRSNYRRPATRDTTSHPLQSAANARNGGSTDNRVLSLDDIRVLLSELAVSGEGAQKTQAARLLMSMSGDAAALPDPMSTAELVTRGTRLMRGMGRKLARICFVRAFPRRSAISEMNREIVTPEELGIDVSKLPYSLKQLKKRYPVMNKPGTPKGYPVKGSVLQRHEWCQEQALKIENEKYKAKKADAMMTMNDEDMDASEADPP